MEKKKFNYGRLFLATFTLSAFTFGGGYVIVPLMKRKFVDGYGWLEENEMLDIASMAQSAPGAVAVNAAILLGYRLSGLAGAMVAMVGTVLPPLLILSVVSVFYTLFRSSPVVAAVLKGMMAGVAAVILDVLFTMCRNILKTKQVLPLLILLAAFLATVVFHVNVAWVILVCGILGALAFTRQHKGEEGPKA